MLSHPPPLSRRSSPQLTPAPRAGDSTQPVLSVHVASGLVDAPGGRCPGAQPPRLYPGDSHTSLVGRGSVSAADQYSIAIQPAAETHLAVGGYDHTIRLLNLSGHPAPASGGRHSLVTQEFYGHTGSITGLSFSPTGSLLISGSKDRTIRFWDLRSGRCVKVLKDPRILGEITSVSLGGPGSLNLAALSRDGIIRIWDLRTDSSRRLAGVQNSTKHFVRLTWAHSRSVLASGSEDGNVHLWETGTGNGAGSSGALGTGGGPSTGRHGMSALVKQATNAGGLWPGGSAWPGVGVSPDIQPRLLRTHQAAPVYGVDWNESQGMLLSCGEDRTVRTWGFSA
ncbi:hypothetical protein H696_04744 [Fonticula alba]|uniref:Anaphase-promoting complex subunit 4 WD40 domain-containing protein n=1 Tax=Fonticula alba TaxID=691883 RepID=A0A058Z2H2_FONAL|nr:hypothetical protein H696_04744 [Fonticula alba]KCV68450.1 hypothetical protein H696_04744 [Fonticula alba]|eukprot:XP_009496882.1 hypothetical protein H696_04744 [Fonticula alba]